jgi:WD40 repeat protein
VYDTAFPVEVALSEDGAYIAALLGDQVHIWSIDAFPEGEEIVVLPAEPMSLGFGKRWIAFVGSTLFYPREFLLTGYDAATGEAVVLESSLPLLGLAYAPDARRLAVLTASDPALPDSMAEISVWDFDASFSSAELVATYPIELRLTWSLDISPDGSLIATAPRYGYGIGYDDVPHGIEFYDALSGDYVGLIDDAYTTDETSVGTNGPIAFSPDGRLLQVVNANGDLEIWGVPEQGS